MCRFEKRPKEVCLCLAPTEATLETQTSEANHVQEVDWQEVSINSRKLMKCPNLIMKTGTSRPTSRSGSRGPTSSRNGSRPASRANSDLSGESIEGLSQRKLGRQPRFSSTATGLRRTPSEGTGILGGKERWKWHEVSASASSSQQHIDSSRPQSSTPMKTTTMTIRVEESERREIRSSGNLFSQE